MSDAMEPAQNDSDIRPGSRAPLAGGLLVFLSLAAGAVAVLAGSRVGQHSSGGWFRGVTLQALLTGVWMMWSGGMLVRRAVWHRFRLPGAFAVAGGVVGFVASFPYSFTYSPNAESAQHARSFCIIGVITVIAGLGHLYAAKRFRARRVLHRIALFAPIVLFLSMAYTYLTRGY